MKSDVFLDNVGGSNISLPLSLVAVVVLISFEEERWTTGCALLAASMLISRAWRHSSSFRSSVAAGGLARSPSFLPPLSWRWRSSWFRAAMNSSRRPATSPAGGSNLHGRYVFYNLSLRGLAERFDVSTIGVVMRAGVAIAAVVMLGIWSRNNRERGTTAAMATALLLAFMLAGPLSEAHYLLVACPCLLLVLALRPRLELLALAAPGFALMFVPRYYFGDVASAPGSLQIRYFVVEVRFFVTAAAAALTDRSGTRAPRSPRRTLAIRPANSG
jgi:hypothetical protein